MSDHEGYALFLFRCGGEAYIPMLLLLLGITVYAIIKKNWFVFFVSLNLIAREAVIFLTAPASFIQYSYPMMYVTAVYLLLLFVDHISQRLPEQKQIQKLHFPDQEDRDRRQHSHTGKSCQQPNDTAQRIKC